MNLHVFRLMKTHYFWSFLFLFFPWIVVRPSSLEMLSLFLWSCYAASFIFGLSLLNHFRKGCFFVFIVVLSVTLDWAVDFLFMGPRSQLMWRLHGTFDFILAFLLHFLLVIVPIVWFFKNISFIKKYDSAVYLNVFLITCILSLFIIFIPFLYTNPAYNINYVFVDWHGVEKSMFDNFLVLGFYLLRIGLSLLVIFYLLKYSILEKAFSLIKRYVLKKGFSKHF